MIDWSLVKAKATNSSINVARSQSFQSVYLLLTDIEKYIILKPKTSITKNRYHHCYRLMITPFSDHILFRYWVLPRYSAMLLGSDYMVLSHRNSDNLGVWGSLKEPLRYRGRKILATWSNRPQFLHKSRYLEVKSRWSFPAHPSEPNLVSFGTYRLLLKITQPLILHNRRWFPVALRNNLSVAASTESFYLP